MFHLLVEGMAKIVTLPITALGRAGHLVTRGPSKVVLHDFIITNPAFDIYQIHLKLKGTSSDETFIDRLLFTTRQGWLRPRESRCVLPIGNPVFEGRILPVRLTLRGDITRIDIDTDRARIATLCKKWWPAKTAWTHKPY
jgi:hypothetical protein